ncbi:MAG: hypothetical protein MUC69_00125 [Gemmatimonadales bacterium]|jgi:hypothetical protein|nr:hypothetical protein [Gemmatimonadales bacterium]
MLLPIVTTAALATAALLLPPTTTRYQVVQRLQQEIDATGLGGGKQSVVIKTTSFIAVTLSDTVGGKAMRVVVDSIKADSLPPGFPADSLTKAKGAVFTGFIDAIGKVSEVKAQGASVAGVQLEGFLREMYPRTKGTVKIGDAWTDTTTSSNPIGNGEMSTRSITKFRATASEKMAGVTTTRIDADFTTAMAGSQATPGGSADIEGTGTGTAHYYMAADGRLMGGESKSTSNLSVTVLGQQSATLPVTIEQSVSVKALP